MKDRAGFQNIVDRECYTGRKKEHYRYQKVRKQYEKLEKPETPQQVIDACGELAAPAPRKGNDYSKPQRFGRDKRQFQLLRQEIKAKRTEQKQREKAKSLKEKQRKRTTKVMKARHSNGQPKLMDRMQLMLEKLTKQGH